MKTTKLVALVMTLAVALFILIPSLSWAEDGAALYKTKCAACHGADAAALHQKNSCCRLVVVAVAIIWPLPLTSSGRDTGITYQFFC